MPRLPSASLIWSMRPGRPELLVKLLGQINLTCVPRFMSAEDPVDAPKTAGRRAVLKGLFASSLVRATARQPAGEAACLYIGAADGERPHLPLRHEVAPCEGTRGLEGRRCRSRSSGRVLMVRPRPVVRRW